MNKFWRIIIYGGLPFSILGTVVCLCVFFPRIDNLGLDYMGIIVGIPTLLVTLLTGWNIYSALSLEKQLKDIKARSNDMRTEFLKIQKENELKHKQQQEFIISIDEYVMGITEAVQAGSLINNPYETRFMQIYKCYTSAIMHFLRCNRDVSNHITDCLDNMEKILVHWKSAKENRIKYNNFIKNTEGFENAINEIISSPSREFTAEQRIKFITLEELRKQIIQP